VTAQRVEHRSPVDKPVPYALTARGEAATRELLTTAEASALVGVNAAQIARLARRGVIAGTKVGPRRWLVAADSVRSYAPKRPRLDPWWWEPSEQEQRPGPRRLPARPFLRQLDRRGGSAACGVRQRSAEEKAIERARRSGVLTEVMADRLSIELLGLTMWEVWTTEPE
jgi:excisionase family DNA binding protein